MVAWNVQWNLLKHQLLLISHANSCNACTLTFSLNILTERFHGRWHDSKPQKKMPIASAVCICVGSDYVWGAWQHFFLHFPVVQSARRNANSGNCTGTGLCCSHTVTILILTVWQLQQSFRTQRASAEVCVCVDMDTNKSLNFDVSLSMPVLFFWIYWETKRAERLEDWEVVTSLSV